MSDADNLASKRMMSARGKAVEAGAAHRTILLPAQGIAMRGQDDYNFESCQTDRANVMRFC